jgi:TPR repeat protein
MSWVLQEEVSAMYHLALMQAYGRGVDQDWGKAARTFQQVKEKWGIACCTSHIRFLSPRLQLSDSGHVPSQLMLGKLYLHGQGVQADYRMALQQFDKASEHALFAIQQQGSVDAPAPGPTLLGSNAVMPPEQAQTTYEEATAAAGQV